MRIFSLICVFAGCTFNLVRNTVPRLIFLVSVPQYLYQYRNTHSTEVLIKGEGYTFKGGEVILSKCFMFSSNKGSSLQGKNSPPLSLPEAANSCLIEQTLFQKGIGQFETKKEIKKKLSPLLPMAENLPDLSSPLNVVLQRTVSFF